MRILQWGGLGLAFTLLCLQWLILSPRHGWLGLGAGLFAVISWAALVVDLRRNRLTQPDEGGTPP